MRIRLTEAQAWETLARFFGGRTLDFRNAEGLCRQLSELRLRGWIKGEDFAEMGWTIDRVCYRSRLDPAGFIWPRDAAGAKARARFCWRQVKRLKGR